MNKGTVLIATLMVFWSWLGFVAPVRSQGPPKANVVATPVVSDLIREKTELIGTVEPWRESTVAAEVSGKVEAMTARRGTRFISGQTLARLASRELEIRIREAEARRNATSARLEKAQDLLERSVKLMEGQGIPERELTQARLSVQELEAERAAAESEIDRLRDEIDKKTVASPFTGVITQELTEVGEWVEQGGAIAHIVDFSRVRVLVDLPERYVAAVNPDEPVKVRFDALANRTFEGKVHALIPYGDKNSRLFPLEVYVDNPDHAIKGGMLARVGLGLGLRRTALMVPKDSVITRGARTYLFTVEEGVAKQVVVTTDLSKGDLIEVSGPLKEGQMVVVRGNERIRDGQSVQIVPMDASPERPALP